MVSVYLDQAPWIYLSKAQHGRADGERFREALMSAEAESRWDWSCSRFREATTSRPGASQIPRAGGTSPETMIEVSLARTTAKPRRWVRGSPFRPPFRWQHRAVGGLRWRLRNHEQPEGAAGGHHRIARLAPARARLRPSRLHLRDEEFQGTAWALARQRLADWKPAKNRDLWEQLSTEAAGRKVDWVKVDGHSGDELKEYADKLACAQKDAHAERSLRLVE